MIGMGTLINVGAILLGGVGGLLFGRFLSRRFQDVLTCACGICTLFLGISGTLEEMLTVENGQVSAGGGMMMICCFILGGLLGEWFDLEGKIERFGGWLRRKTHSEGDGGFVNAFLTATLTTCIGAMAVVGSIQDGLTGDYATLAAKSVLDLIIILAMTASLGKGCIFAAIPVGLFQGSITLLARGLEPLMIPQALSNLSLTGNMLIFCVGVNLVWGKKVPVGNLLPTIFLAVAWAFLPI